MTDVVCGRWTFYGEKPRGACYHNHSGVAEAISFNGEGAVQSVISTKQGMYLIFQSTWYSGSGVQIYFVGQRGFTLLHNIEDGS